MLPSNKNKQPLKNSTMKNAVRIHNTINLRAMLIDLIMKDVEHSFGGKGNATVTHPLTRINAGLQANKLVHAKI